MYNWSTDTTELKKDKEQYAIWKLTQMINSGEAGEKLDEKLVRQYWEKIKDRLDPSYRAYLKFLLWPKKRKAS